MGDANPIRTLGDYSKPSHEGYRNTIELPEGNNVAPLRSDTIRLVQNGCSFQGLRSEDPKQHLKDFLKLVDSLELDDANRKRMRLRLFQFYLRDQASNWLERLPEGSISTWEDLTSRFLAQFFPPGRTAKLRNDILMFQQHQRESLLEAWTRFKDLLQKVPHRGIDRWLQIQIFYDHVSFPLKCDIYRAASGKLRNKSTDEYWEIIENLALYDHEGWNDSKNFGSQPTPRPSSTHTPQAYADVVYSNPHPRNQNEPPKQKSFTFHEPHTERIESFENAIFKQREEINDRMAEMFGLLKELTTSRAPEKVLIREEAKYPVTKNVNSLSLTREEEEKNDENDVTTINDIEKTNGSNTEMPVKKAEKENKAKNGTKNETIKRVKREEVAEAPNSQPVGYYRKHRINEKLIEGLVDNHRGPVYEAILKKKITKKEDIGGNFEIPCNIGGLKHIIALVDQGSDDMLDDVVGYVFPVDFVILDIKEDEKMPFILGTPFLTTAKAMIKFDKGTITLRSRKSKISFHRIPESLGKVEKGIKNDIEPIAPTMTMNRLVLEYKERIKLHQEKELEFDQWRSKNFKNKHLALVKVKGEKMEGEVT
ncbi:zinc finger, CCHC-type containing protein [Tanacetum coccineum]